MSTPAIPTTLPPPASADLQQPVARLMSVGQIEHVATKIAKTDVIPKHFRGRPGAIIAAGIMGRELGWGLMTSLRSIYVVDGTPDLATEAKLALAMQHGHFVEVLEQELTHCTVKGIRSANAPMNPGKTRTITYTLEDAQRAGLVKIDEDGQPVARSQRGKPKPWELHPKDMLYWRAVSRVCKQLWPEVTRAVEWAADNAAMAVAVAETTGEAVASVGIVEDEPPALPPIEIPNASGEDVPPCPRVEDGLHDMTSDPWCALCQYDPLGKLAEKVEAEKARVDAIRKAIADADCEDGPHHETEIKVVPGDDAWYPVCTRCGLDPGGYREAYQELRLRMEVEGNPGADLSPDRRLVNVVDTKPTPYQEARQEACDHSMGHDRGWCRGCGYPHPDYTPQELFESVQG